MLDQSKNQEVQNQDQVQATSQANEQLTYKSISDETFLLNILKYDLKNSNSIFFNLIIDHWLESNFFLDTVPSQRQVKRIVKEENGRSTG